LTDANVPYRTERDPLGEVSIPMNVMYGVQTLRALKNFHTSPLRIHPELITAYAEIKKAAAEANMQTGELKLQTDRAIVQAADKVISGRWRDQFDHDAVPMSLGEKFCGYADNLKRSLNRLAAAETELLEVPLGGTAVGTGINAHPDYARLAITMCA
jgi:aspartate ammonia-lyase